MPCPEWAGDNEDRSHARSPRRMSAAPFPDQPKSRPTLCAFQAGNIDISGVVARHARVSRAWVQWQPQQGIAQSRPLLFRQYRNNSECRREPAPLEQAIADAAIIMAQSVARVSDHSAVVGTSPEASASTEAIYPTLSLTRSLAAAVRAAESGGCIQEEFHGAAESYFHKLSNDRERACEPISAAEYAAPAADVTDTISVAENAASAADADHTTFADMVLDDSSNGNADSVALDAEPIPPSEYAIDHQIPVPLLHSGFGTARRLIVAATTVAVIVFIMIRLFPSSRITWSDLIGQAPVAQALDSRTPTTEPTSPNTLTDATPAITQETQVTEGTDAAGSTDVTSINDGATANLLTAPSTPATLVHPPVVLPNQVGSDADERTPVARVALPLPPTAGVEMANRDAPTLRVLDYEEIAFLNQRGKELIAVGDIVAARLMLERAAESGDPDAALILATTYDQAALKTRNVLGISGDAEKANFWSEKAKEFRAREAARRLEEVAQRKN